MKNTPFQNAVILIVDDESENSNVLFDALQAARFRVLVAPDGELALRQSAAALPDLILLDVMMPGLDGFEVCRRLKANAATSAIPVIFMTVLAEASDKVRAFAAGGVDYITKPIQIAEVLARVQAHLTIRRQQQHLQQQHARLQQQHARLRQQHAEIEAQREQLRDLNATKDKFVAILAHDLKNPLIAFLSFGKFLDQMLAEGEIEELTTMTGHFREEAQNLYALLDNLLTWAQLQQGRSTPLPQEIPLGTIVSQNLELAQLQALQKQITLTNLIQDKMVVFGDIHMIDTIVRNLLSNALKFTRAGGGVELSATQDAQTVTVMVTDAGIGIPPEKLANLFRIDVKCQRPGTAGEKGTGLGLILCKEFVERNGGRIWVESAVGKGTTVYFTLPAAPAA